VRARTLGRHAAEPIWRESPLTTCKLDNRHQGVDLAGSSATFLRLHQFRSHQTSLLQDVEDLGRARPSPAHSGEQLGIRRAGRAQRFELGEEHVRRAPQTGEGVFSRPKSLDNYVTTVGQGASGKV
jgi:hypothetical protein